MKHTFKPSFILTTSLMLGLFVGLSACSNNEKPKPKYKTIHTLNQQQTIEKGTVVAVRTINVKPAVAQSNSSVGISAGSGGFRGIHAAIDLATLGRIFTSTNEAKTAQEITVKKDNGQTVAITQTTQENFKQGDTVKIVTANELAQVIY